jgi:hypothetical protein
LQAPLACDEPTAFIFSHPLERQAACATCRRDRWLFRLNAIDSDHAGGGVLAFHLFKPGPDVLGPILARGSFAGIHGDQESVGGLTITGNKLGLLVSTRDHLASGSLGAKLPMMAAAMVVFFISTSSLDGRAIDRGTRFPKPNS